MLASIPANKGEMNQLSTTFPSYFQFTQSCPPIASPEPIIAPTIVCDPLIGTPIKDDVIINNTDEKQVPSIMVV